MAAARAAVAEAEANHAGEVAGPTRKERAIVDAQVQAAASALAVLERHLGKTILHSPVDGIVSVIVAEVGENLHAGQPDPFRDLPKEKIFRLWRPIRRIGSGACPPPNRLSTPSEMCP